LIKVREEIELRNKVLKGVGFPTSRRYEPTQRFEVIPDKNM
jgi:hypothetical protein